MAAEDFFSRWSRKKVGGGAELPPPQPSPSGGGGELPPPLGEGRGGGTHDAPTTVEPPPPPPPPTLEDAQALTPEADFRRFIQPDVAPEVKNVAVKKLFADPRYNVMDGLDVYIDDYSKPDPIPESMLRKLATAQFLGLFREKEEENRQEPREGADDLPPETVAQCEPAPPAVTEAPGDAHPDLRLQQDDAPPGEEPGRGPE